MSDNHKAVDYGLAIEDLQEQLLLLRDEYTISVIGSLIEGLTEGISQLKEKAFYDAELNTSIKESFTALAGEIKKISEIKASVTVDLKPVASVFAHLSEQNKIIINKINTPPIQDTDANKKLVEGILSMMERQNTLFEKMVNHQNEVMEKMVSKIEEIKLTVSDKPQLGFNCEFIKNEFNQIVGMNTKPNHGR